VRWEVRCKLCERLRLSTSVSQEPKERMSQVKKLSVLMVLCMLVLVQSTALASDFEPLLDTNIKAELTIWGWSQSLKALSANIEAFNEIYPNVTFRLVELPHKEHHMRLLTAMAARRGGPDIAPLEGVNSNQYAGRGLVDLTEKLEPYRDQFPAVKWGEGYSNGRQYGVPYDVGPTVIYYRADVFEKVGLDPDPENFPKTWDELLEVGRVLKEHGYYLFGWDYIAPDTLCFYYYRTLLNQLGRGFYDGNGKVLLGEEPSRKAAQLMLDMVNEGLIFTDAEYRQPGYFSALESGDIAAVLGASWFGGILKTQVPRTEGLWRIAPMPAFEPGGVRTSNQGGTTVAILEQSKNKELAWEYLRFSLLTAEGPIRIYEYSGVFPAFFPAYESPIFGEADPFFGGQKAMRIWADQAKDIPLYYYMPTSPEDDYVVNAALVDILLGNATIEEALNEAKVKIIDNLKNYGIEQP